MFLDTSSLYALLDASESRHLAARAELKRATRPFTHSYVLAEWVPLAQVRGVPRGLLLDFIFRPHRERRNRNCLVGRNLHEAAHHLLRARPDKSYSLCDAVSFVLMPRRGEHEALTTDHHFEQEGFIRLLAGDTNNTRDLRHGELSFPELRILTPSAFLKTLP